jgi:nitronate monooxygenase
MLATPFTAMFGIEYPLALAPMGGAAGGALAAAVSNGGGLGLLGAGRGDDPSWLERELDELTSATEAAWGVGFQAWAAPVELVERAVSREPAAVMVSFGDPEPLLGPVRASAARLIVQVTDLDEARRALDLGADVLVAQGADAGGHGGTRGTFGFVPAVVDLADTVPVLAAGAIADGRGLAAALTLGAAGALVGTRFLATPEALISPAYSKALLEHDGGDTERSRVLDIARGAPWPARYTARTITTGFLERWRDHEQDLRTDSEARAAFQAAAERADPEAAVFWAGEALDLVHDLVPASDLVRTLVHDGETALRRACPDHKPSTSC